MKLILWSTVAVIAGGALITCAVLVGGGRSVFYSNNRQDDKKVTVDIADFVTLKEVTIEDSFQSLDLDWVTGHVTVYKSEDGTAKIVQKGIADFPKDEQFTQTVSSGVLEIKDKNKCMRNLRSEGNNRSTEWTDLELYLPQKEYDTLFFQGTAPKVSAHGLKAKLLKADITSGSVELKDANAEALDFHATSGEITCNTVTKAQLKIDMTSGDAEISGPLTSIHAKSTSGEMKIKTTETAALDLDSTSGHIEAEGSFTTIGAKTTSGSLKVNCAIMPSTIRGDLTAGSLKIYLPRDESGFIARVDRNSHDGFECDFPVTMENNVYRYGQEKAEFSFDLSSGSVHLYQTK